jgi:hypothetical protein
VTWRDEKLTQRVWIFDPTKGVWDCQLCGHPNRPRAVPNSLGTVPQDHKLFDPAWRQSHCEQCGAERVE